jgi:ribosome-associated protein
MAVSAEASQHPLVSPQEFALLAIGAAIERKAFAPILLDLRNQHAFTDYFAILSASNARQVAAVADGIRDFAREHLGVRPVSVDGMESLNWVLLDYGSVFIHIFQTETRSIYRLEEMWSKARVVPVDEASFHEVRNRHGILAKA